MKKKVIVVIGLIIVCMLTLVACAPTSNGMITNGDFEQYKGDNLANWSEYKDTSGDAVYKMTYKPPMENSDDKPFSTGKYLEFDVSSDYGAYQLRQNVKLKKDVVYKLSYSVNIVGDISNYNYNDKIGLFVGILEGSANKEFYNSSKTDLWQTRTSYIKVENNGTYTFAVGIGLKDKGARGRAWVDNITLQSVESAPPSVEAVVIENAGISDGKTAGVLYTVFLAIFALVACAFVYYMLKRNNYKATITLPDPEKKKSIFLSTYAIFAYSLIGMFLIRFLITYFSGGMSDQLKELGDLALKIKDVGLAGVYSASSTPIAYGMLYILAAIGGIGDVAGLTAGSTGMLMMLRLPQIIADLVIFYLIFSMVGKNIGYKQGALVAGLFAVMPAMFSLSATWGMNASIPLAFIVGAVYCMIDKKYFGVMICTTLAIMFNVNAIIMLPIVVMYLAYYMWKEKNVKLYVMIPVALLLCLISFYLLALPFTIEFVKAGKFFFVFEKMGVIFKSNVKMTNDVFNLYAMFGLGNATTNTATKAITGILMSAFIIAGGYVYLKSRNRLDWLGLMATAFLTYAILGIGASFDMVIVGIVLLLVYAVLRDDKRLYKIFSMYSILFFINIGLVLISSGVLGDNTSFQALFKNDWVYILGSILAVILTGYYYIVLYDITLNDYNYEIEPMESFKGELIGYKSAIVKKFTRKKK